MQLIKQLVGGRMYSILISHTLKFNEAITELFKLKHHESALMLIYAFIDRMAWVSVEGEADNTHFKAWVNQYLLPKGDFLCSADDLWGARCALLHTGSVESRDSKKGRAKKVLYHGSAVSIKSDSVPVDRVFVDVGMLHTSLIAAISDFNEVLKRNAEKLTTANLKLSSVIKRYEHS
jgi:hypothetical protein